MAKQEKHTPPFDPETMRHLRAMSFQNPHRLQEVGCGAEQHTISQSKEHNIRYFMGEIVAFFEREPHAATQGVQINELSSFLCPDRTHEGSFSRALMWLHAQGVLRHNDELRLTYAPHQSPAIDS